MELKEQIEKALAELRKEKERKFDQTADLIVNLQKFDIKKTNVNIAVNIPHKIKDKKICGFLEAKNKNVDTIIKEDFKKYNDKKSLKKLVDNYDFFIAQSSVMPAVATTFGRVLGPAGKMPSPQLGIIVNADDKIINELKERVNNSVKVKIKEASIKIPIGKMSMKDGDIAENVVAVYNSVLKELPRNKENIKNIEIKFTMTKPIKIKIR
ncbi:MAG: hypothetical protein WC584_01745 [Candidatus Pacearchaeota archaeon]